MHTSDLPLLDLSCLYSPAGAAHTLLGSALSHGHVCQLSAVMPAGVCSYCSVQCSPAVGTCKEAV